MASLLPPRVVLPPNTQALVESSKRQGPLPTSMAKKLNDSQKKELDFCPFMNKKGRNCRCMDLVTSPYHLEQIMANYREILTTYKHKRVNEYITSMLVCGGGGKGKQLSYKVASLSHREPFLPAACRVFYICRPQFLSLFDISSTRLSALTQKRKKQLCDQTRKEEIFYWLSDASSEYYVYAGKVYPAQYIDIKSI